MPNRRVMGDAVILCDGTIGFFNGGHSGTAGWSGKPITFKYRDGTKYACKGECSMCAGPGGWEWGVQERPCGWPGTGRYRSCCAGVACAARSHLHLSLCLPLPAGKCSKANRDGVWTNLEPTIYSPTTGPSC